VTKRKIQQPDHDITWERVRAIFGDPPPVHVVWEKQFDGGDDNLRRIAATPYDQIDPTDLWYYFHDLGNVDLQPELFRYLFPVCLMDWHESLMRSEACSHGDSEFHRSIVYGRIFERMLSERQRDHVFEFFRDSFVSRLDAERGFKHVGCKLPAFGWTGRLNSLAMMMPRIDSIWTSWWNFASPGRALCAIQYVSALIYVDGENPLWPTCGGCGPCLWENDSHLHEASWLPANLDFLRSIVTPAYILQRVDLAADRLAAEPEGATARQVAEDARRNRALVESRIAELPTLLQGERPNGIEGWSV